LATKELSTNNAIVWMNLENIVLSERSHTKKTPRSIMIPFTWKSSRVKSIDTKSRLLLFEVKFRTVTKDWGVIARLYRFLFENVLILTMVMIAYIHACTENHRIVYFTWVNCLAYELSE
jgi:hypothetical protein